MFEKFKKIIEQKQRGLVLDRAYLEGNNILLGNNKCGSLDQLKNFL